MWLTQVLIKVYITEKSIFKTLIVKKNNNCTTTGKCSGARIPVLLLFYCQHKIYIYVHVYDV